MISAGVSSLIFTGIVFTASGMLLMSKEGLDRWVCVVLLWLSGSVLSCLTVLNFDRAINDKRDQMAVDRGVAEWRCDSETGEVELHWLEMNWPTEEDE